MGKSNYNDDFKRDAVHQIVVRGYAVRVRTPPSFQAQIPIDIPFPTASHPP